jgi:hypothetical protein
MEPEDSLLCLQEPATGPYPVPDESTLHPHIIFLLNPLILFSLHVKVS